MDKIVLFIPMISGYISGLVCGPGKNAGYKIPARPPGYVFGIIWPTLYLSIGYSWYLTRKKAPKMLTDILYSVNTLISAAWLILFGCLNTKRIALYDLIALIASTLILIIYSLKYSTLASCLLAPYLAWLIFAQKLNYSIVNES
jgi:translocator protein